MKNIAIVADSNSGITQSEAKELGVFILPTPFTIEGKEYLEGVSLEPKEFFEMQEKDLEIFTSQPAVGSVLDLWEELLKSYDEIVYIPMSSGLSGSCQTAQMLSNDYDGRIQVVNNQRVSVTQRHSVMDALNLSKAGYDAAQIREILERDKFHSGIYIMVDTLKYLKKGGRITPAAAAIGTVFHIKPVLQINGEKLDAFSKVRGIKQAKKVMIDALVKDFKERVPGGMNGYGARIAIAHTANDEEALILKDEILELFPEADILINPLSLVIACHIGPGALAIAWSENIPELQK